MQSTFIIYRDVSTAFLTAEHLWLCFIKAS